MICGGDDAADRGAAAAASAAAAAVAAAGLVVLARPASRRGDSRRDVGDDADGFAVARQSVGITLIGS